MIERKSKENEEKNIKPITTKISNQINNYECKCGIEFVNICKCQKPNYELYLIIYGVVDVIKVNADVHKNKIKYLDT